MNYETILKQYANAQLLDHQTRQAVSKLIKVYNKSTVKDGPALFNPLDIFKYSCPQYHQYINNFINTQNINVTNFFINFNTAVKINMQLVYIFKKLNIINNYEDILSFYLNKQIPLYFNGHQVKESVAVTSWGTHTQYNLVDKLNKKTKVYGIRDYPTMLSETI